MDNELRRTNSSEASRKTNSLTARSSWILRKIRKKTTESCKDSAAGCFLDICIPTAYCNILVDIRNARAARAFR